MSVLHNHKVFYKSYRCDLETIYPSLIEILQAVYDLIVDFSICQLNYYNYIKILALFTLNAKMSQLDLAIDPPNRTQPSDHIHIIWYGEIRLLYSNFEFKNFQPKV